MLKIDKTLCNENFGKFIRGERERKGLLQSDIAKILGITQANYSQIESGSRTPDLSMAINICLILGLNFNDFVQSQINK